MITKQELEKLKQTGCCLIAREGSEQPNSHEYHICDCTVLRIIEALEVATEALLDIRLEGHRYTEDAIMNWDTVQLCSMHALKKIYG